MNEGQVVSYNITDVAIQEMSEMYLPLVITDLEDAEQFAAVHSARMIVRGKRIEVDKTRKGLKADALAWSKAVQDEANRISALIEPIESHLKAEENKVAQEKQRIEDERINTIRDTILSYHDSYHSLNGAGTVEQLRTVLFYLEAWVVLPEAYFELTPDALLKRAELITMCKQTLETRIRLDQEEADRMAEDERLAAEREKQEAKASMLRKEQEKLVAAQKRIDEEKAELAAEKRAGQERKDREEFERKAKEQAVGDAREEAQRLALEADKEAAEAAEAERQKALLPDKEKLVAFSQFLSEGITYPIVDSPGAEEIVESVSLAILIISEKVFNLSQKM